MSKYTLCFGAGVRLVNFGSFTFLSALACRGWKNGKVPKCAAGRVGLAVGLNLLRTVNFVANGFLLTFSNSLIYS